MDGRHADDDFVSKVNNSLEKALCNTLFHAVFYPCLTVQSTFEIQPAF